jgi:hypothetical protein
VLVRNGREGTSFSGRRGFGPHYFAFVDAAKIDTPLGGDCSQLYPMHMKHNGATRTLLRLIDGVFPNSAYLQCKLLQRPTQNGCYSAPALPTTTALPQIVPLSPLMSLVAPRVAAAALDGSHP